MNIDAAISLILKHLSKDDGKIFIQVDADCDGFTSAACLINYLHRAFPTSVNKIVYAFHPNKTHGIELAAVPADTTLVIAPDASSNEYDIHKTLQSQGKDVLVIDHHLSDRISEYACVVNNQLCDYPNKTLSGVGVVYKVCERMDELMHTAHSVELLDLVATGLVGDMMDIRNMETRYLVQEGFKKVQNPFVKGMMEKNAYSIGDTLTPIGVAFYIVPLVNAVTRVGTMDEKVLLFESMLEHLAYNLIPSTKRGCKGQMETVVEQALRTCTNVKNRQTKLQDAAVETIERVIADGDLLDHKLLLIRLYDMEVDRGITGLIANKFMAKYKRPVVLLQPVADEKTAEILWMGSARGYEKSKLTDFRQFCRESQLVFLAEGHANAFGFGIKDSDFDKFIEYSDEALKDVEFSPIYKVDYIFTMQNLDPQIILDIGTLKKFWGQNIDEALVVVENIPVTKDMLTLMSRDSHPTLKIQLPNGVACIKFKSSEEEYNNIYSENGCAFITIIGRCEVNRYYNNVTPQILVEDYEILEKKEWYF